MKYSERIDTFLTQPIYAHNGTVFVIDWKTDSFLDLQSSYRNINDSNQVHNLNEAFPSLSWPLSSRMH